MNARAWVVLTACLIFLGMPAASRAEGWKARLFSHPHGPEEFLAIDKDSQTFYILQQKSPLRVTQKYPCTTGREQGDKLKEGDMRTPEGVYFVQDKLTDGLDYALYGDLAFPLNFPNPVDRIKGKTGYGIWIHGRGTPIVDRETQGCVALNTPDIHKVEKEVRFNLPVIIAESVDWGDGGSDSIKEADELAGQVEKWARDWQRRSDDFFAHYDPKKFSISEAASFDGFVNHKQGIFQSQPWIQVMVGNIRILPGPDYWVTCFDQYYRTQSLTSQVGKRFYWQKDEGGAYRIVGREYADPGQDLEPLYLAEKEKELNGFLASWRTAWEKADLNAYMRAYADGAVQEGRAGRDGIEAQKRQLWALRRPEKIRIKNTEVRLHPRGLAVQFVQEYKDSSGYSDKGIKHLVVVPEGDGWAILSEQWRDLE